MNLEAAVRVLGPERCRHALRAYTEGQCNGWIDCPIAFAYGEPNELAQRLRARSSIECSEAIAADELGVEQWVVEFIIEAYDGLSSERRHLRDLLEREAVLAEG